MTKNASLAVFISHRENMCADCGDRLGKGRWITLDRKKGATCLACSDLDHLVFLPSGDAALTRRAKKHSTLSAVVLKFSRARKRNERQGLLVEGAALEQAEEACLVDEDVRARRRERDAARREARDEAYVETFAAKIRELFPFCPAGAEDGIAEHACLKSSGRVGRSAAAKSLDEEAVRLAVIAHVRHAETNYDELLSAGQDRERSRAAVWPQVEATLAEWRESR